MSKQMLIDGEIKILHHCYCCPNFDRLTEYCLLLKRKVNDYDLNNLNYTDHDCPLDDYQKTEPEKEEIKNLTSHISANLLKELKKEVSENLIKTEIPNCFGCIYSKNAQLSVCVAQGKKPLQEAYNTKECVYLFNKFFATKDRTIPEQIYKILDKIKE